MAKDHESKEKLLKIAEFADQARKQPSTVRSWVLKRKVKYVKLGRSVLIPESEFRRLVEEGTVPALNETGRGV